jgi:hypothetical protein
MNKYFLFLIPILTVTGCGSLTVTNLNSAKVNTDVGVPYYLPEQEFIVNTLDLDTNHDNTTNIVFQVSLVTKPDYSHGFLIKNSPAAFATGAFDIEEDPYGKLVSLSGGSDDQSWPTVQTVVSLGASVASSVAAFFSGAESPPPDSVASITAEISKIQQQINQDNTAINADNSAIPKKDSTQDEAKLAKDQKYLERLTSCLILLNAKQQIETRLQKELSDPKFDVKQVVLLQDSLDKVNQQIATALNQIKPADTAVPQGPGVYPSGTTPLSVKTMPKGSGGSDVWSDARSTMNANEIKIYVVPSN